MRRFTLAAGAACAVLLTGHVGAQFNTTGTTRGGGDATMPGQAVSTYRGGPVTPVGQRAPDAAPQAGQSVTANAMSRPYDPNRPYDMFKGTNIDTNTIVAPLVGADGRPVAPPDALDQLTDRLKAVFGLLKPPPRPAYAPGINRRATERTKMMWRRD